MQLEKYALSRLVGIYKANVWNTNHLMHSAVQTFKMRKVFVKKYYDHIHAGHTNYLYT